LLVIVFQYLLRLDPPLSRSFLFLLFLYDFILLALFRWSSPHLIGAFQRGFGSPYHIVIVGDREKASRLREQLCRTSPFRIAVTAQLSEVECGEKLPRLLAEQVVDEVIFEVDSSRL